MNEDERVSTRSRTAYDPASDPLFAGGAFENPPPPPRIPRKWPEHLKPANLGQSTFAQYHGFNPVSVTSVAADSIDKQSDTSPPSYSPRQRQHVKHTLKAWAPELFWCIVSIGCLVAIVATLNAIDQKPQPKLPLNVPITAVIAFLATFCRMTLTFPVIDGVSQLKWNWYAEGKARPLANLETFDTASRGAWGSMKLLWIAGRRVSTILVFIIMVTGFLTSSITQAALTTTQLPKKEGTGNAVVQSSGKLMGDLTYFDSSQLLVQLGYSTPPTELIAPLAASCGSGYCDFPTFHTLGVCTGIRNITDRLTVTSFSKNGGLYNATLPNGARLDPSGIRPPNLGVTSGNGSTGTGGLLESIAFGDQPDMLATRFLDLFVIWRISDPDKFEDAPGRPTRISHFRAFEVLFHLCVKTVDVKVRNGQTVTNMTDSETRITATNATVDLPCQGDGDPVEGAVMLTTPDDVSLGFESPIPTRLYSSLAPVFMGSSTSGTAANQFGDFSETLARLFWPSNTDDSRQPVTDQEQRHEEIIQGLSRNVADILTNSIRKGAHLNDNDPYASCKNTNGTEFRENMIKVRWEWLTLLIVQVAVSILFLVMVMIQTRSLQVDVLKSELLPALLAMDPASRTTALEGEEDHDAAAVRKRAPRIVAGLENQGTGWALKKHEPGWM